MSRQEILRNAALSIVSANQPCTANHLVRLLRQQYGTSQADATRTMLEMVRDGQLRRTGFAELYLPGTRVVRGSGRGYSTGVRIFVTLALVLIATGVAFGVLKIVAADKGPPEGFPDVPGVAVFVTSRHQIVQT